MNERKPGTPQEIDDTEDRMGSIEPLDFDQRKDQRKGRIGDELPADEFPPQRTTGGETASGEATMDDLTPENLIPEDGARSASERGHGLPADQDLSIVGDSEIGAGGGLDEAEAARQLPLDGKPWDVSSEAAYEADDSEEDEDALLPERDVLSDDELEGDAPLDSGRDKTPGH